MPVPTPAAGTARRAQGPHLWAVSAVAVNTVQPAASLPRRVVHLGDEEGGPVLEGPAGR